MTTTRMRSGGDGVPGWATTPVTEIIAARRSVRDGYRPSEIPIQVLREILSAGLAAPSSKNARPWRLHVVRSASLLREIADAAMAIDGAETYVPVDPWTGKPRPDWPSSVGVSADVLRQVPAAIFVENLGAFSRGRRTLASLPPDWLRGCLLGYTFEVLGIGAAIENMWLAANALGVHAAYMGDMVIAEELIARRLGIEVDLVGVLALGYSELPPSPSRLVYNVEDADRIVWHEAPSTSPLAP